MDKYTIETLKAALCRELDEYARQGIRTHQDLDIIKDLLESLKNLEELEMSSMNMEPGMENYSLRGGNSYGMRSYAQGNSYNSYAQNSNARGGGGNSRANNSYHFYDPYMMNSGYSRTGSKEEIMQELRQMVQETSDEEVKNSILDCLSKMEK